MMGILGPLTYKIIVHLELFVKTKSMHFFVFHTTHLFLFKMVYTYLAGRGGPLKEGRITKKSKIASFFFFFLSFSPYFYFCLKCGFVELFL